MNTQGFCVCAVNHLVSHSHLYPEHITPITLLHRLEVVTGTEGMLVVET